MYIYNTHRYAQNVYVKYIHIHARQTQPHLVYIKFLYYVCHPLVERTIGSMGQFFWFTGNCRWPFCSALRIILNDPERMFFRASSLVEESRLPWWLSSLTLACGPGSACIHIGRTLYTYIYTYIHIYIHIDIYIYIHIYIHMLYTYVKYTLNVAMENLI